MEKISKKLIIKKVSGKLTAEDVQKLVSRINDCAERVNYLLDENEKLKKKSNAGIKPERVFTLEEARGIFAAGANYGIFICDGTAVEHPDILRFFKQKFGIDL